MHVLIVGGTSGIGLAIVQALCFEGYSISALGRSSDAFRQWDRRFLPPRFFQADLAELRTLPGVYDAIEAAGGPIDAVIHAGAYLHPVRPVVELGFDELNRTLEINLKAPLLSTQLLLPKMLARSSGTIINLSSRAANKPAKGWLAYSASKAGLEMISQSLALELKETAVRVYSVNPGATRTSMRQKAFPTEDPTRLPEPLETVGLYVHLLKDRPPSDGKTLDLYDWLDANPDWRNYGLRLRKEFAS